MHMSAQFIEIPIVFRQPVFRSVVSYTQIQAQIISPIDYGTRVTPCSSSYSLRGACALLWTL